ncbi:PaaI family thioesterase [Leisingera sp. M523]|uniref:PaaI family thioesterase n=1 Tax=Leisingera sp. M523 TaxID=2867013 RepID=UPI0021A71B51|nr:PaaI family thioesterase [Leisingera sp. M523]UWQ29097.1 PaaI family thioesterase [Leisingera sp. M523]
MALIRPGRPLIPLFEAMGYGIELDPEAVEAHCVLEISSLHLNRQGSLHGGVAATLLDTASGITASLTCDPQGITPFATLSLNVSYMAVARSGRLRASGQITGGGSATKFVSCGLRDETGRLIAASTGVFKRVRGTAAEDAA